MQVAVENDAPAPPPAEPYVLQRRLQYCATFPKIPPSSLGEPKEFARLQASHDQHIVWSRPPTADEIIPVVLYHPIMRQFIDDCANHQPVGEDNSLVLELTNAMSRFFPDESARAKALRDTLIDNEIQVTTSTVDNPYGGLPFLTDGAIECGKRLISIFEVKAEIGSKGAEPFAHAVVYYHHSASRAFHEAGKYTTVPFNFPCLIITVFGLTFV